MRIAMLSAAILAATTLGLEAGAQRAKPNPAATIRKDEKVIIRNSDADETVVEIRDGAVFVNGDEVASLKDARDPNLRKTIVISSRDAAPGRSGREDEEYFDERSESRAALGVFTDPSSRESGAAIKDVHPGSAAEKAGLRKGDLITSVDGNDIASAPELVDAIARRHKPGDEVLIGYERGGSRRETRAVLTEAGPRTAARSFRMRPGDGMNMPGMPEGLFRSFPFASGDEAASPKIGVSAEDRADGNGVRVLAVKPGSPAAEAGIREGDVLTRVDDETIGSVDELQMSVRSHKAGDRLELKYERDSKTATTAVLLPKELKRKDL